MARTRARVVTVALAGVGGVVAAHTIGFVLAIPNARARAHELAATGHDYWSVAVAVAVIASSAALVAAFGSGRRATPRAGTRAGASGPGRFGQWAALSAWQIVMFSAMEVTERLEVREPLHALLDERAFRIGLALQLVVAAIAIAVLAVAEYAGGLVVRVRRSPRAVVVASTHRLSAACAVLHERIIRSERAARAPPVGATL
jgi:hypothetical protein